MLKKLGILAAVLTTSLAVAVPSLAQETIPTALTQTPNPSLMQFPVGPLENQNDICPDKLLEREPDTYARDCGREEGVTPRGTQQLIEDTKQEAVDDEFGASSDGDVTKGAPSTVSEGAQRPDAERDETPAVGVSPTETTGATPQAGAQPKAGAESEDFGEDFSGEGTLPEKRVANTDEDAAGEPGLSEEVVSGGRIVSKGSVPKGNARKAAAREGAALTDSGARKAIRKEARKTTKAKAVSKQDRKAPRKAARTNAAGGKEDRKAARKAARANAAGSKEDRKAARKAAHEQVTPDKDTSVSGEVTDSEDPVTDGGATPGDGGGGEGDNTIVATPAKSNVPLFLGGGVLFVTSVFLVSKAILSWFRSPLSRRRWLLRP